MNAIQIHNSRVVQAREYDEIMGRKGLENRAEDLAAEIVANAQARATAIVEDAKERALAMEEEMRRTSEDALERFLDTDAVDRAAEGVLAIFEQANHIRENFDNMAPWLSPMIAAAVVRIVGTLPEETVWQGIVTQSLTEVRDRWDLVLRCHPERQDLLERVIEATPNLARVIREVQGDRELEMNDCVVVSAQGVLDISVQTQLKTFTRALEKMLAQEVEADA